jgi:hypothetical protein
LKGRYIEVRVANREASMVEPKLQFRVIFGNDFPINLKQGKPRVLLTRKGCGYTSHPPFHLRNPFTFYVTWRVSYRVSARALVKIQINLLPQTHFQFLVSWKGIVLFIYPEVTLTNFEMIISIIVVVRESE